MVDEWQWDLICWWYVLHLYWSSGYRWAARIDRRVYYLGIGRVERSHVAQLVWRETLGGCGTFFFFLVEVLLLLLSLLLSSTPHTHRTGYFKIHHLRNHGGPCELSISRPSLNPRPADRVRGKRDPTNSPQTEILHFPNPPTPRPPASSDSSTGSSSSLEIS